MQSPQTMVFGIVEKAAEWFPTKRLNAVAARAKTPRLGICGRRFQQSDLMQSPQAIAWKQISHGSTSVSNKAT